MTATSDTTLNELKELIGNGFSQLNDKIERVDRKIDEVRFELRQEISEVKSELKQEIGEVKSELKEDIANVRGDIKAIDARLVTVEKSMQTIPDLAEKVGELKNWKQIGIVLVTGTVGTIFGWVIKGGRL